jgi:hypothetical protein
VWFLNYLIKKLCINGDMRRAFKAFSGEKAPHEEPQPGMMGKDGRSECIYQENYVIHRDYA